MRAQSGTPVMRLQPGSAAHLTIGPGVDLGAGWPVAFIEAAKDQPVSALHPRLDRAENGQPGVGLPGAPHRPVGQKLGHDVRKGLNIRGKAFALFGK